MSESTDCFCCSITVFKNDVASSPVVLGRSDRGGWLEPAEDAQDPDVDPDVDADFDPELDFCGFRKLIVNIVSKSVDIVGSENPSIYDI